MMAKNAAETDFESKKWQPKVAIQRFKDVFDAAPKGFGCRNYRVVLKKMTQEEIAKLISNNGKKSGKKPSSSQTQLTAAQILDRQMKQNAKQPPINKNKDKKVAQQPPANKKNAPKKTTAKKPQRATFVLPKWNTPK